VELLNATSAVAHRFTDEGSLPHRTPEDDVPTVIGLLSPSSLDFVITLFAAMRMGLSVLLIAHVHFSLCRGEDPNTLPCRPQCTPAAVSHLCLTTRVTHLVYDSTLSELAQDASRYAEGRQPLQLVPLPSSSVWSNVEPGLQSTFQAVLTPEKESSQTCFIYHSSGTTSGLPKPLPQTHRIMSVLHPHLPGSPACFSTTPLYHGGLADLVRSLNSAAMLYLFPPGVPITRTNILKSLAACGRFHAAQPSALQYHTGVKLLSCVPYVLKMLVENDGDGAALAFLRGLDFLGTGGAPLPQDLGDRLVREGVRLVSRYGSAECGFLMSSARDFANDREWQYLRSEGSGGALVFEEQEDETVELVIQSHWPCMVGAVFLRSLAVLIVIQTKMNRPDGSFATSDLYVRHPSIPDAWKYLGRKDDMVSGPESPSLTMPLMCIFSLFS
jgi:acyl-CoA synthetase (AMP-forming)/AMP-acid ligase II